MSSSFYFDSDNVNVMDRFSDALARGSDIEAMMALSLVSAITVIPLTLIRKPYCFSVGYGMSVGIMYLTILALFDCNVDCFFRREGSCKLSLLSATTMLAWTGALHGFRLAAFLLFRELSVPNMRSQTKVMDKYSRISVVPLAVFLSIFYAIEVSPVLFAHRRQNNGSSSSSAFSVDGGGSSSSTIVENLRYMFVVLALIGLVIESVTDYQKWIIKYRRKVKYGGKTFVSPTGGFYAICRHPNFLGEIVVWTGLFLGSVLSFGDNLTAWGLGLVGWSGIFVIMTGSAKRLDVKHEERYSGQLEYEEWKNRVKSSFYPGFPHWQEQYPVFHPSSIDDNPTLIKEDANLRRDKVLLVGATGSLGKDIVTELRRQNVHLRILGRSWDSFKKAGLNDMPNVELVVYDVAKAESAYNPSWCTDVQCLVCVARPRAPSTPLERMAYFALVDNLSRMACEYRVPRMLLLGMPYMTKGHFQIETKSMNLYRQTESLARTRATDSRATELTVARIAQMSEANFLLQAAQQRGVWPRIKGFNPHLRFITSRDFALAVANYVNTDEAVPVKHELLVGGPQLVTWQEFGDMISDITGKQLSMIDLPLWLLRLVLLLTHCLVLIFPFLGIYREMIIHASIPMTMDTTSDKHEVIGSDTIEDCLKAYHHEKRHMRET